MPASPLQVTLSEGQKLEALKRIRERYQEELGRIEAELGEILTQLAEADFLAAYLGEQPEVKELRSRQGDVEKRQQRRDHLVKLIDRLDQIIPKQPDVAPPPPAGAPGRAAGLKRY